MRTRREFLRDAGCGLGAAAFLSTFGSFSRLEAAMTGDAATDYRALVCVFLYGGNDGNNTVIPYDDYASYNAVRPTSLNIPKSDLLRVDAPSQKAAFGLHPSLVELQALYQSGRLAVLANVGTLAAPIDRAQYLSGAARPDSLFSHSDQVNAAQSAVPFINDQRSRTGWGGRLADTTASLNAGKFPMVISVSGVPLFGTGVGARALVPGNGLQGFSNSAPSKARYSSLLRILQADHSNVMVDAANTITSDGIQNVSTLNDALGKIQPISTTFPDTSLGNQMLKIAQVIAGRDTLKINRQIFFASLGGFDTHTDEVNTQGPLLTEVSQAMSAFYNATVEMGVATQVTAFTMSDFGRTLQPASGGGSDHAWGNHHFILGGAVKGGDFYGTYPTLALRGPDDASSEGRWVPTTSIDQYAATLAQWYGVAPQDLPKVFPYLDRFATNNLGFI